MHAARAERQNAGRNDKRDNHQMMRLGEVTDQTLPIEMRVLAGMGVCKRRIEKGSEERGDARDRASKSAVMPGLAPDIHVLLVPPEGRRRWPGRARP
jgi:hypothetical protein